MLIEYKISCHQGVVTVTQRIEPDNSPVTQRSQLPVPGIEATLRGGKQLGTEIIEKVPESKKLLTKLDDGGSPSDKADTGGGRPSSGLVIAFGPVVLLGAGLMNPGDGGGAPGDKAGPEGFMEP